MGWANVAFCQTHAVAYVCVLGLAAVACGGDLESKPRVPLSEAPASSAAAPLAATPSRESAPATALSRRARAALDSGNAQMRQKRYSVALESYRKAVREAPGHTAPEFGVFMAAQRLGNTALADSAQRIINAHTGGSPTWTDSTIRSTHGERPLPKSHPKI